MASREQLNQLLETLCDNVHFQPPANVQIQYPAIVYNRSRIDEKHADNVGYNRSIEYDVFVISRNPDESIVLSVAQLPLCRHNRYYVADNLNHDAFTLYY